MVMSLFFCVRSGWEWDSHVSSVGCRTIVDCMHFSSVGALIIPFLRMHFSGAWIWPARGTVFMVGCSFHCCWLWILVLRLITGVYGFWCCCGLQCTFSFVVIMDFGAAASLLVVIMDFWDADGQALFSFSVVMDICICWNFYGLQLQPAIRLIIQPGLPPL